VPLSLLRIINLCDVPIRYGQGFFPIAELFILFPLCRRIPTTILRKIPQGG
jgi:hypothetical protein